MKVLVACEESQRVCIAFREKGHEALNKKYTEVLNLAKENADSNEYCLQELEKENEKLKKILVDIGFWDINGKYKEDFQKVDIREL